MAPSRRGFNPTPRRRPNGPLALSAAPGAFAVVHRSPGLYGLTARDRGLPGRMAAWRRRSGIFGRAWGAPATSRAGADMRHRFPPQRDKRPRFDETRSLVLLVQDAAAAKRSAMAFLPSSFNGPSRGAAGFVSFGTAPASVDRAGAQARLGVPVHGKAHDAHRRGPPGRDQGRRPQR